MLGRSTWIAAAALLGVVFATSSCGDDGFLPTSVDPGSDFVQDDVVFDEQFYYCRVEPMLFEQGCGSGVAGKDPENGCHFSVSKFKLTSYTPRLSDVCTGNALGTPADPNPAVPRAAQQNYTAAQARMKRDPNLAALLLRPTGKAAHPRQMFAEDSDEAAIIRQWAAQFSSQ